jgi:hypothetical protein
MRLKTQPLHAWSGCVYQIPMFEKVYALYLSLILPCYPHPHAQAPHQPGDEGRARAPGDRIEQARQVKREPQWITVATEIDMT